MYFNSIKVQLELCLLSLLICQLRNFNSIKVQLELKYEVSKLIVSPFQFHKGTIRTEDEEKWQHRLEISIP